MRLLRRVHLTHDYVQGTKSAVGESATPAQIGAADACPVETFRELFEHVARIAILNKDFVFYFRGQAVDFKNQAGRSTLYPTIYRGSHVGGAELASRFTLLRTAAETICRLIQRSQLEGKDDIRKRLVQWSLLQHYEICGTPLLDLTSSLRVACSFALENPDPPEATVYVCGLPYPSGRISINSEHDTVNVRLLGICPPAALRPLLQEGHVVGTYDVEADFAKKDELDFANRLVAKFRIPASAAFRKEAAAIARATLYPDNDPLLPISDDVRGALETGQLPEEWQVDRGPEEIRATVLGYFLETWTRLEQLVVGAARLAGKDTRSLSRAIEALDGMGLADDGIQQLGPLARIRNKAVHRPEEVDVVTLRNAREEVLGLIDWAEQLYATVSAEFGTALQ